MFFFFQAEDGIRDKLVTGVQTCALPICVRVIFQADAVRVGPTQFPRLNQLYTEVLTSLDWPERPELFVSQTPFANAGAFGMDKPFIVINSGTLKLLDDDELRNVLGHELGHVMSGDALYHTILVII